MPKMSNRLRSMVYAALGSLVVVMAGAFAANTVEKPTSAAVESSRREAMSLSAAFRATSEEVLPSVVTLERRPTMEKAAPAKKDQPQQGIPDEMLQGPFGEMFKSPQMKKFFEQGPQRAPRGERGLGSGVIIDKSGLILTNNHVVEGAGKLIVRLHDGREFEASDVKTDPKTDLAIVKIEGASDLKAARLGNSDKAQIGDWVLALGQPFGLEGTVTAGIISAKDRGIGVAEREGFIQTDAAINPGNSGGPLVNLDGEVIAINTAISSSSGGNQGIGFSVPINQAKWVTEQLVKTGSVQRSYLGVSIQPVTYDLAKQFGAKDTHGVVIADVLPNTPAAKAGLKSGDLIVRFDDNEIDNPRELQQVVEMTDAGSKHNLTVLRDGKETSLSIVSETQPGKFGAKTESAEPQAPAKSTMLESLGLEIGPLDNDVASKLGLEGAKGVVITQVTPNSPADVAHLSTGMVIVEVNRKPVTSVDEISAMAKDASSKEGMLLLVKSAQGTRFVVLKPAS